MLVNRSGYFADEDRALIAAVYERGSSVVDLAKLAGTSPRNLRRRIKALVRRALSPRFAFVATSKDAWTPRMKQVGTEVLLRGRSMRETARRLGITYHTVRRYRDAIDAMAGAACAGGPGRAA